MFTTIDPSSGFACGRTGALGEPGTVQCWGNLQTTLNDVTQLAVGGGHVCALHDDGSVSCWGSNSVGQTGIGGTTRVEAPTKLEWLQKRGKVRTLSVGQAFGCATLEDGTTTCWGRLRTHPRPPPMPAEGGYGVIDWLGSTEVVVNHVDGPTGLVQHSGGGDFACGVRAGGSVVCWGHIPDDPAGYGFVEQPLNDAVQVVAGSRHACAVDSGGAVWCWRDHDKGQLGGSVEQDSPGPVQVRGLPKMTRLTAGSDHTCAQTRKGAVWCWGARAFGALGDGLAAGSGRPVLVEPLPSIATISAGGAATCAVPSDAKDHPWCWGGGRYAPHRDGWVDLDDVVEASAGESHTCARTSDGSLWCWGARSRRGDRSEDGGIPTRIASNTAAVAAGKDHTCMLGDTGKVSCWGDNEFGQLDGQHKGTATPMRVDGPSFTDLAASGWATCGRDAAQMVWCWGQRDVATSHSTPVPEPAFGPGALLVGDHHTCTLHDGRMACMGEAWYGALGVPGEEAVTTPTLATTDRLRRAVVRGSKTCGIRDDDSLWCWGGQYEEDVEPRQVLPKASAAAVGGPQQGCAVTDEAGHVTCWGDMGPPFDDEPLPAPTQLEGVDGVLDLAMGNDHTCARHTTGKVTCWGRWRGGSGFARPWAARNPVQLPLSDVAQLVAGDNHTCARTAAGAVWCWGANANGEVGDGTRERRPKPVQLDLTGIRQLAAGSNHTCARGDDATWCWGDDPFGQLGLGDRLPPRLVPFVNDAVALAAGYTSSCATGRDGAHTCWGRDLYADLYSFQGPQPFAPPVPELSSITLGAADMGCGQQEDRVICWGDPLFDALGPDVGPDERLGGLAVAPLQVAVGDGHTCILAKDQRVICFGANHRGQSGGTGDTVVSQEVMTDGVSVAAGQNHACAVRTDGRIACWGDNEHGQLGVVGPGGPEPKLVEGITDASWVIAGWHHTCALTPEGLRCWGRDHRGQLGRGAPLVNLRPWRMVDPKTPSAPSK